MTSPVFDLQQVTDEAVPSTALYEVPLSGQEGLGGRSSVLLQKVVEQRQLALLLHLVEGHGVHHRLDHPAVWWQHQDLIGLYPEGDTLLFIDRLQVRTEQVSFSLISTCWSWDLTCVWCHSITLSCCSTWKASSSCLRSSPHLTITDRSLQCGRCPYGDPSLILLQDTHHTAVSTDHMRTGSGRTEVTSNVSWRQHADRS